MPSLLNILGIPSDDDSRPQTKQCVYCHVIKPLADYPKHRGHKDRLDTRCRECIRQQSRIRREISKTAPPKPEVCDLCGKKPPHNKKIVLDHCHKTHTFRGWLCDPCNVGLGNLGDDLEGVLKAVDYLSKN